MLQDSVGLPGAAQVVSGLYLEAIIFAAGAGIGWLFRVGRDRWRTRRARSFWQPFLRSDVIVVLGRFREFDHFERSGFLGVGDALAHAELMRVLTRLGAETPRVAYADELVGERLDAHLICLGGPDANRVTALATERMRSCLSFGDPALHEVAIRDVALEPPETYVPRFDESGTGIDYGVILSGESPFAVGRRIVIMAGAFGHGTLAAVQHAVSARFLDHPVSETRVVECLVQTDVAMDRPQSVTPLLTRPLGVPSRAARQVAQAGQW